ncbi:MAG: hypothetical protein ACXVC1_09305 [Tumebacillaceae bacterium]
MEKWKHVRLPKDFVRYVQKGCMELAQMMEREPDLPKQIEEVIREQISHTPMEALEIEYGLSILTGSEVAKALMGCLRFLEAHEEVLELQQTGLDESVVNFLRYLVARYGPVLKAIRRRNNHPLGWHKFGHMISHLENGQQHLSLKIVRNDDEVLLMEDDSESMMRLINLMLKAVERVDQFQTVDEETIQEFAQQYERMMALTQRNAMEDNGTKH